jgi:cell division septation protein DedD
MAGNRPAREKFDFSLDARQVAGVILGSLGALGLAFFLGHALGQRVAERPAAVAHATVPAAPSADPLAALDQGPRPDGGEPAAPLSFHEALTSARPPPDRLPPAPRSQVPPAPTPRAAPPIAPPQASVPPAVAPVASGAAVAAPAGPGGPGGPPAASQPGAAKAATVPGPAGSASARAATAPPAAASPPKPATPQKAATAKGTWVVQVGATQERFEAERIAARFASRNARVTVADLPGKGRVYRVRIGSFDSRESADRYLRDLERTTGAKGFVASAN